MPTHGLYTSCLKLSHGCGMEYELVMWNKMIHMASSYTILEPYLK